MHKKYSPFQIWNRFLGVSLILHALVFLVFLLPRSEPSVQVVINRRIDPASIKIVPHIKSVSGSLARLAQHAEESTPPAAKKINDKAVATKKDMHSHEAVKSVKTPKKSVSSVATKKDKQKSSPKASQQSTIVSQKQEKKSMVTKPTETPKTEKIAQHQQEKKEQPKTGPSIEKHKMHNKTSAIQAHNSALDKQVTSSQESIAHQSNFVEQKVPEPIIIGTHDAATLQNYLALQHEIEQEWSPPSGLAKDLQCTLDIVLNQDGKVNDIIIKESSRVISYDIAARNVARCVTYPKNMWGNHVVLTFKQ